MLKYLALCLATLTVANASQVLEPMRISLSHIEGGGVGYDTGYTSITGFFAPNPECLPVVPFVDLQGHIFNDKNLAANIGVGLRDICECWVFGGNVYFDYRQTDQTEYKQIGVGFEALSEVWEARINGYLPIGKTTSSPFDVKGSPFTFQYFQGHYLYIQQTIKNKIQFAMKGLNAELGYHFTGDKCANLFLATGPYYYTAEHEEILGAEARFAAQLTKYVQLEGIASFDKRFHLKAQALLSITIPLGCKTCCDMPSKRCCDPCVLRKRMIQNVARQEIVVVDKKKQSNQSTEVAIDPRTGAPYYFIFVNNTSSSNGTFESPYPTLVQAQNASGVGTIIYVYPGDRTTNGQNAGITLQDYQRLWGTAVVHNLPTAQGEIAIPELSAGSIENTSPVFTIALVPEISNAGGDVVTLANNNEISGIYILSTVGNGITGSSVTNLTVANNIIQGPNSSTMNKNNVNLVNPQGTIQINENLIYAEGSPTNLTNNGVSINATNIQNAQYIFDMNDCTSNGDFFVGTLTDCSNITTTITNSVITCFGAPKAVTVTNSSVPQTPNFFNYDHNTVLCNALDLAEVSFTLQNYADVVVSITNASVFTPFANGLLVNMTQQSQLDLTFEGNTKVTWLSGVRINMSNSASMTGSISNNTLAYDAGGLNGDSEGGGVFINVADSATIPSLTISGNGIQGLLQAFNNPPVANGIIIMTYNAGNVAAAITNNDIEANHDCIALTANDTSTQNITLSNNFFTSSQANGLNLSTNQFSQGIWNVSDNTIVAMTTGAALVTSNGASTTCLSFTNNLSAPVQFPSGLGAFQFTNAGGTFNLEPLVGNTGFVTETGVITNVPAGTCQ